MVPVRAPSTLRLKPNAARQFDRRGADEAFNRGIDHRRRSAVANRLLGQHASGEGDRTAVVEQRCGEQGEVHLAHQLIVHAQRPL